MKNRAAKDEELHTWYPFVHVFRSNFATFRVSVSTPNFQKSTPNFSAALTFESERMPLFCKNGIKCLIHSYLAKPLEIRVFSSKIFFVENFQVKEAKNALFVNIFQKKYVRNTEQEMMQQKNTKELSSLKIK